MAELAVERGAERLLIPISARRQLNDPTDETATRITIDLSADPVEALRKALTD